MTPLEELLAAGPEAASAVRRGYRVLHDEIGVAAALAAATAAARRRLEDLLR
jgi:hypothetical protein